MKTVLLELTEAEVTVLQEALNQYEDRVHDLDASRTFKENLTNLCGSIVKKTIDASQEKSDVLVAAKDLFYIISMAKEQYHHIHGETYISHKRVEESDFKHISLANAVILWLNKNDLLKNNVRFDFTDQTYQYEGNGED
jgi:hypothetical protein